MMLTVVLVAVITSCGHTAKVMSLETAKVDMGDETFQYFYLEAVRQQTLGNYDAAFDLFKHCTEIDSLQPDPYYELCVYYSDLNKDSLAQSYINRAVTLNPANDDYRERQAQLLLQQKNYESAITSYEQLWKNHHDRTDVLEILLELYQQKKAYNDMLSVLNRMEQTDGKSEQITLSKMQVYQMKGDKNAAYKELKGLSDEHPNDVNYKVMTGNWLLQNDRADEAGALFIEAEKDEPNNEYVAASLYDYYRQTGNDSLTAIYRDRILLNKHTESRTKITMFQQIIHDNEKQGGDSTKVLALFRMAMESSPEDADLAQLNAVYMSLKNMPEEQVDSALQHVLDIAPDNSSSRLQLLQNKWDSKNWDELISLAKAGTEFNPDDIAFYYFLGMAYYQKDDRKASLETFQQGVRHINDNSNKDVVSDFYAMMGDIYHQLGNDKEAYAAYDSCLQWKPDNNGALNNYAYYLSENKGDLQRAEAMSHKTIIAEPDNATYLDTYAWILYQQERYLEAEQYIDKAVENLDTAQNNSTVLEHAGDIHLSCDDRKAAVDYWKKALDEGSEEADRIKKKIKANEK